MKKIILAAVVCCMAVSAALFTSCQKGNYNKRTYFIGVIDAEDYNTNATPDKTVFEQYLTSKGFKNTGEGPAFGYYGELNWTDDQDADQLLQALWEPLKAKLSYDEIDALPFTNNYFHVTLGVSAGSSKNNLSPVITWFYPNPSMAIHWTTTNNPLVVPTTGKQGAIFTVECNKSWTSEADRDWVTYSPTTGDANQEVTITVNIAAGPEDSAKIVFTPKHSDRTHTYLIYREDD